MRFSPLTVILSFVYFVPAFVFGAGTVTISVVSPQNNQTIAPGTEVDWRIEASVSSGDNEGLALFLIDFHQLLSNPEYLDIPLPDGVPAGMEGFAGPAGFSNPNTGYLGQRVGNVGARNLAQIGGAQNTFGISGVGLGQDVDVDVGVGQNGQQIIAQGSFQAPSSAGLYQFLITNALTNTLANVAAAPNPSTTETAAPFIAVDAFSFTVDPSLRVEGDMNCDGQVDTGDIAAFALALISTDDYETSFPDCDITVGDVNIDASLDGRDISGFAQCLLLGGCP